MCITLALGERWGHTLEAAATPSGSGELPERLPGAGHAGSEM